MRITIDDVQCLVSAVRLLTEEEFSDATILPKKRLAVKLYVMASDKSKDHLLPKWVKSPEKFPGISSLKEKETS